MRGSREGVFGVLTVDASVASRTSHGGTAPAQVRARIADAKALLGQSMICQTALILLAALALGGVRAAVLCLQPQDGQMRLPIKAEGAHADADAG